MLTTYDFIILAGLGGVGVLYYIYTRRNKKSDISSVYVPISSSVPPPSASADLDDDASFVSRMKSRGRNLVIFYGSQTGTAEDFAARLAKESVRYGMKALTCDPEECDMRALPELAQLEQSLVIFCVATYGEGDPTDNLQEFYELLMSSDCDLDLTGVRYCVFGLGNKTYEHYNLVGTKVDDRLAELGGQRILPLGLGDDDSNIEEDFVSWKELLWPTACAALGFSAEMQDIKFRQFKLLEANEITTDRLYSGEMSRLGALEKQRPPFDAKNPFVSSITVNKELHTGGDRSCLHLELDITGSRLRYEAGDHVAIYAPNRTDLVTRLGELLNCNLDTVFSLNNVDEDSSKKHPFPCPTTYRTAFTFYLDITANPKTNVLLELADYCSNEDDKQMLLKAGSSTEEGKALFHDFIIKKRRNIIAVLEAVPSCSPAPDHLCELLPRLQARYYSIASSPKAFPTSVHVCAAVVHYKTLIDREVWGVATGIMVNQVPTLPIYIRRSQFRLPYRPQTPVIMVGPGTGFAPFRGFLQERQAAMKAGKPVGPTVLYTGCRNKDIDFIYEEELSALASEGVISNLQVAFSRDQDHKIYVQDLIRKPENSQQIWSLLQDGAHFYVCGDAKYMARDVMSALEELVEKYGEMSRSQAQEYIKKLAHKGRYSADVWS